MRAPALLLLALACSGDSDKDAVFVPDDSGDADADTDTDTDDAADVDGDGWTVGEGDCDDDDIYANPAWDEDPSDGKDNDCDGRIDEVWAGLAVAYTNSGAASTIVYTDNLGRDDGEVALADEDVYPAWIDGAPDGGFVINDSYARVSLLDADGVATALYDFSEEEEPRTVYGVATLPDGTFVASTLDSLVRVNLDGTIEELATWNGDLSDTEGFELAAYTLAVDLRDGTVGLFGYFGGFATWTEVGGFVQHRKIDLAAHDGLYTYAGAAADGGGWYVAAVDGSAGTYGVYGFDDATAAWTEAATWTREDWTPVGITIDGDTGDWYVTANAGWYYTVWRIREADGSVANFYITDGTEPYRSFQGLVARYE